MRALPPLPVLGAATRIDTTALAAHLATFVLAATTDEYPYVPLRALYVMVDVPDPATVAFADLAKTAIAANDAVRIAVISRLHAALMAIRHSVPGAFTLMHERTMETVRRMYVPGLASALAGIVSIAAESSEAACAPTALTAMIDNEGGEDAEAMGRFASEALTWPPAPTMAALTAHLEACLACTIDTVLATAAALRLRATDAEDEGDKAGDDSQAVSDGGDSGGGEAVGSAVSRGCTDDFAAVELQLAVQAAKASSRNASGERRAHRKRRRVDTADGTGSASAAAAAAAAALGGVGIATAAGWVDDTGDAGGAAYDDGESASAISWEGDVAACGSGTDSNGDMGGGGEDDGDVDGWGWIEG